jgi:hypothetical protein
MHRAPREQAAEQRRDPPEPVESVPALDGPNALMFLQATAGNQAVARGLARRALQREPASPGVDHAADASNVTITFVMRDFNLPKSRDASTIDFLHEPGVSFQVTPKQAPEPVVQAALSAINLHLQRHGNDLVELSVDPQASIGGDKPTVGAQAQAEIHVTATFSITASTSAAVSRPPRPGEELDPSNLRLSKPGSSVDITWSPISLGVLYKLGGAKEPPPEKGRDSAYYESITPGKNVISWVAAQLDRAEFTAAGASDPLDVNRLVTKLFDAMVAAGRREPKLEVDLGWSDEPPGLVRGLARAGTLIAGARPDLAHLQTVQLAILKLARDGKGPSSLTRLKQLAIGAAPVTPPTPPPAPTPPMRTWGTGPPVTDGAPPPAPSGPAVIGPSRVLPAPPPVRDVPKEAPAPRTWGVDPPPPSAPRTWGTGPPAGS